MLVKSQTMISSLPIALLYACAAIIRISVSSVLYWLSRPRFDISRAYILENQVTHVRLRPSKSAHSFAYPTISLLVSLNALESHTLDLGYGWIFGYGGSWGRLTGLCSSSYLIDKDQGMRPLGLKDKLIQVLEERGYDGHLLEDAWMMTMPSFLGWAGINPLTVYFCYKSDNDLWITVLEVHNTFGEGHVYIMEIAHGEDDKPLVGFDHQWTIPRAFHVSPFNDRSGFYRIAVKSPSHSPSSSVSLVPPRPVIRIHLLSPSKHVPKPSEISAQVAGSLKLMATLRPTVATPLTISSLLSALCRMPFALLLTFPRILHQAKILHYEKQLDVSIRPEPYPFAPGPGLADRAMGGGIKWRNQSTLESHVTRIVEQFLSRRVDDTSITVTLVSGNPSVPQRTFTPAATCDTKLNRHLIIHYLSPRFFTLLFQSPSAAHAYLLGSATERVFTASSTDLFMTIFASDANYPQALSTSSFMSPLSMQQRVRRLPIPLPLLTSPLLPIPATHPLDSPSIIHQLISVTILCGLLFFDHLERWVFNAMHARVVPGDEPWKKWIRAERVLAEGCEEKA